LGLWNALHQVQYTVLKSIFKTVIRLCCDASGSLKNFNSEPVFDHKVIIAQDNRPSQTFNFVFQTLLALVQDGQKDGAEITLEKSILALKILRKLIIHGLKKPEEHAEAMAFVSRLFDEAKVLLEVRRGCSGTLRENVEKYSVLCQKIWSDLLGELVLPKLFYKVTDGLAY
jgi:hypothetical protein